jgi:hypothetical protein
MSALKRPPPAAALSTYMHELYAKGTSFDAIAAALNRRGERGMRGGRWFAASVRLFLLHTQPGQPNL